MSISFDFLALFALSKADRKPIWSIVRARSFLFFKTMTNTELPYVVQTGHYELRKGDYLTAIECAKDEAGKNPGVRVVAINSWEGTTVCAFQCDAETRIIERLL